MQEYLGADKLNGCTAEEEHHLSQQHQPHKPYILSSYTRINDGLCEEWKYKLQERAKQQTENELRKETLVFFEIPPKEFQAVLSENDFRILLSVEVLSRLKEQGYAFLLTVGLGAYPMFTKLFFGVCDQSPCGVSHIDGIFSFLMLPYFINNDKVVLIPMKNTR